MVQCFRVLVCGFGFRVKGASILNPFGTQASGFGFRVRGLVRGLKAQGLH